MDEYKIPSLGRKIQIGDLYDARSNQFCQKSIFLPGHQINAIIKTSDPKTDTHILDFDSHREPFEVLGNFDALNRINLLAGVPKISNEYLRFFAEIEKTSLKTQKKGLLFTKRVGFNMLDTRNQNLGSIVSWDTLKNNTNATHVVKSVEVGFNTFVTFNYKNVQPGQEADVRAKLDGKAKELQRALDNNWTLVDDEEQDISIHVYGGSTPNKTFSTKSNKEAYETILNMNQQDIQMTLTFCLCEIKTLVGNLGGSSNSIKNQFQIKTVRTDILKCNPEKLYVELLEASRSLTNLVKVVKSSPDLFKNDNVINEVIKYKKEFDSSLANFNCQVRHALHYKERSNSNDRNVNVVSIVDSFKRSKFSPKKVRIYLEAQKNLKLKCEWFRKMKTKRAYFQRNFNIEDVFPVNQDVYVFHFSDFEEDRHKQIWKEQAFQFNRFITESGSKQSKPLFILTDSCRICQSSDEIAIHHYVNGKLISESSPVEEVDEPMIDVSMIESSLAAEVDEQMIDVSSPWPQVEGSFKHETINMQKQEINIVLMGETGVGKSTFINSFANYLTFSSLAEADQSQLVALIPTSFTLADDNYDERTITFGQQDHNEQEVTAGGSKTQTCRSYVFSLNNKLIRLIDTPGIGDTRGKQQDEINLDGIFKYLSRFEEIHGICYLMKPNTARLGVAFSAHFQELVGRLHKEASKNIVFVFTNARSTFYRPGDTLPPLRIMLKNLAKNNNTEEIELTKEKYYCLDNEAFRFLVLRKNNEEFTEEDVLDFDKSWIKSASESRLLIDYLSTNRAHSIQDTIDVCNVKRFMEILSQPLAKATLEIQIQIQSQPQSNQTIITSLENEQAMLTQTRAELNAFLSIHAMAPPYDHSINELDKLYADEEFKANYDQEKYSLLKTLDLIRNNYPNKVNNLISTKEFDFKPKKLSQLADKLYNLENVGPTIKMTTENQLKSLFDEETVVVPDIEYNPISETMHVPFYNSWGGWLTPRKSLGKGVDLSKLLRIILFLIMVTCLLIQSVGHHSQIKSKAVRFFDSPGLVSCPPICPWEGAIRINSNQTISLFNSIFEKIVILKKAIENYFDNGNE